MYDSRLCKTCQISFPLSIKDFGKFISVKLVHKGGFTINLMSIHCGYFIGFILYHNGDRQNYNSNGKCKNNKPYLTDANNPVGKTRRSIQTSRSDSLFPQPAESRFAIWSANLPVVLDIVTRAILIYKFHFR